MHASTSRLFVFLAFVVSLFSVAFAAPLPMDPATGELLDKRTTHTGRATYFYPGLGACGWHNGSGDMIVALNHQMYGPSDKKSTFCGRYLQITYGGKSEYAEVVDDCPSCPGGGDLDMSPTLFKKWKAESVGEFTMSWHFQPEGWKP